MSADRAGPVLGPVVNAVTAAGRSIAGIEVGERVPIPDQLIPADAKVEMEAKIAAGYFTEGHVPTEQELASTKGRGLE